MTDGIAYKSYIYINIIWDLFGDLNDILPLQVYIGIGFMKICDHRFSTDIKV